MFKKKSHDERLNTYLNEAVANYKEHRNDEELPREVVLNEILNDLEKIDFDVESMSYLIYFCEKYNKDYSDLYVLVELNDLLEAYSFFEENFNEIPVENILSPFIVYLAQNKGEFDSIQLKLIVGKLSKYSFSLKDIKEYFINFYSVLPPYLKLDIIHFFFSNILLTQDNLQHEMDILEGASRESEYTNTVVKCIVNCEYTEFLEVFSGIKTELIREIIEFKRAINTYDLTRLGLITMDSINELSEYALDIKNDLNKLKIQLEDVKQKLTSLWTNEFVDSANSSFSNYIISDEINPPKILLDNINSTCRMAIGAGFGCFLNSMGEMIIVNLDNDKTVNLEVGISCKYPVIMKDKIFIANDQIITISDKNGEVIDILIPEGSISSIKATKDYVYYITENKKIFIYSFNSPEKNYILEEISDQLITELVVLDNYIVVSTESDVYVYLEDETNIVFLKKFTHKELINIIGTKNILFVIDKNCITRYDLMKETSKTYRALNEFDDKKIIINSETSIVVALQNKVFNIDFKHQEPVPEKICELRNQEIITDFINCDGDFVIIINDSQLGIIRKENEYKVTSQFEFNNSENFLLSSGYGNLFITSKERIYQITHHLKEEVMEDGEEDVA